MFALAADSLADRPAYQMLPGFARAVYDDLKATMEREEQDIPKIGPVRAWIWATAEAMASEHPGDHSISTPDAWYTVFIRRRAYFGGHAIDYDVIGGPEDEDEKDEEREEDHGPVEVVGGVGEGEPDFRYREFIVDEYDGETDEYAVV